MGVSGQQRVFDAHDPIDLRVGVPFFINLKDELQGLVRYVPYTQETVSYVVSANTAVSPAPDNFEDDEDLSGEGLTLYSGLEVRQQGERLLILANYVPDNQRIVIDLRYESQPHFFYRIPIGSIQDERMVSGLSAGFPSLILPGTGDSFLMPRTDFVEGDTTLTRLSGSANFIVGGGLQNRDIRLNSATKNISAVFTYTDTNNNAYRIHIRQAYPRAFLPTTADLATNEDGLPFVETQIKIPPSGEMRIQRSSLIDMLPADLTNKPTVSNIGVQVSQGTEVARYESNLLRLGGRAVTEARRHAVGIAITNTSITGNPTVWAFYWVVAICKLSGQVPLESDWNAFNEIPLAEGQDVPDVPRRSNPEVTRFGSRLRGFIPPPQTGLQERKFMGTLPARSDKHEVTMALGEVRQNQTGIHVALQDSRRLEAPKVQKLEGGIYDVPSLMNDEFYLDWPVPQEQN